MKSVYHDICYSFNNFRIYFIIIQTRMNLFVQTNLRTYCFNNLNQISQLKQKILQAEGIPSQLQNFRLHNKPIQNQLLQYQNGETIYLHLTLLGGKGGFGAKLKNQGSKKVRFNNNNHSRDLTGRRIENTNLQKQYTEFCKKKKFQDEQVQEQRKKFKLMSNTLFQDYAFMRLDKKYKQQLEDGEKNIEQAMRMGLKHASLKEKVKSQQIEKLLNPLDENEDGLKKQDKEQILDLKKQNINNNIQNKIQVDNTVIVEKTLEQQKICEQKKSQSLKRPRSQQAQAQLKQEEDCLTKKQIAQKVVSNIMTQSQRPISTLNNARATFKNLFKKK